MKDKKQNLSKRPNVQFSFNSKDIPSSSKLFELANKNYSTGSPWSVLGFEEDLKTAQAHYGIVLFNNRCIGFIGYHSILGEAEITNFVIAKQFQRQGTALKLLQRCLEKLNTENVEQVFLEVRESNQNAIQLYQKCGFQKIGIRKNYYTQPIENALIMQLAFKAKNEKE